jgi:SNF2 family DNA or RNA helicase
MKLATLIHSNIEEQVKRNYQMLLALNPREQALLTVLAVIFKPIGVEKLYAVIAMLEGKGLLTHPKKEYRLSPQRKEALIQSGLISLHSDGLQINRALANPLVDALSNSEHLFNFAHINGATSRTLAIILAAEDVVPVVNSFHWQSKQIDRRRLIRDFYYLGQIDKLELALNIHKNPQIIDHNSNIALVELLFLPFDHTRFLQLPNNIQYQAFASLIRHCQIEGVSCDYAITLLEQLCAVHSEPGNTQYNVNCRYLLAELYLYQLRFDEVKRLLASTFIHEGKNKSSYSLQLLGALSFFGGEVEQAVDYYEQAIVAKNKLNRRKQQYLSGVLGYFHKLALLVQGNQSDTNFYNSAVQQIQFEQSDTRTYDDFESLSEALIASERSLSSGEHYYSEGPSSVSNLHDDYFCHALVEFNDVLSQRWCNQAQGSVLHERVCQYQRQFDTLNYSLFSVFCEQLKAAFKQQTTEQDKLTHSVQHSLQGQLVNITTLIQSKAQWDVALDKLIAMQAKKQMEDASAEAPLSSLRLIWELSDDYIPKLLPREQKRTKSGWSKGRHIALKRLKEDSKSFGYLSESDLQICKRIRAEHGWGYYAKTDYSLEGLSALEAAVGISNLYYQHDLAQPIELIKAEAQLLVSQQGQDLCLSIADLPHIPTEKESASKAHTQDIFDLKLISDSRYQLTVFSPEHIEVAKIIGEGGLVIPMSAKQKALDGIAAIAPLLNIQSDIEELDTGLSSVEPNPHLFINIEPTQNGLSFSCVVMPFGEQGPAFKPGLGNANISCKIDGKRIATVRDLANEQTLLEELDHQCPVFLAMSDTTLLLDDFEHALTALEELEQAKQQANFELIVRWPKGKKIKLSKPLQSTHLQLALGKKSEWFDITGNLKVNNEQVVELRKLLDLVKSSSGRFIALDNEQVLALSEDLRLKLEQLSLVTDDGKFHALAGFQVAEVTAGMRMKTLHAWEAQSLKMHESNALEPKLPSTFKGQLRDYQLAGFEWALRLAHWGAGACLADDMGLGKTLQALAVILARASKGPSLVIAPTSVCFNWHVEAIKFAPTLNIKLFSDAINTKERSALLEDLHAFDCVIVSYGLLQRESEILQNTQWRTIVADEAQALKNPMAKRSKAACALKADFKMITTGTPIENDLTELWSLFRFVNPGLLGNLKRFSRDFSQPIENAKEAPLKARKASQSLKALIQPFILRRMKHQVLSELPPRTNINIPVSMSTKEQAFYEALRLNAIDNISQSTQQSNTGEQRIRVLAELVKLRQACCNSKLVMAQSDIPSAKLAALDELLDELKLNNHKALVFSQFVGHLKLIEEHIKAKGLSYQYLDGATPQKQRQKAVNAFQRGEGDVFLISLKAGGSGLNLTAADYVIHTDPWWNPAVEEQASDRAHRIGQKRPVTVYRLITQNTIEAKIVQLHQHKRELADTLLSGNDIVNKLSVDDMLNLLQDTL